MNKPNQTSQAQTITQMPLPVANSFIKKPITQLLGALLIPPIGLGLIVYHIMKSPKNRQLLIFVAGLLVALLIGSAAYYSGWQHFHTNTQRFSKLYDQTLPATLSGTATVYKVPVGFDRSRQTVQIGSSAANYAFLNKTKQPAKFSAIMAVYSQPSALATSSSYVDNLNKLISNHQGKDYQVVTSRTIEQFIKNNLPANYKIVLDQPVKFASANINKNAWKFDFTATSPGHRTVKGSLIIAVGKQSFYYLMIASVNYNWNNNAKTFQQVVDSLKIDQ